MDDDEVLPMPPLKATILRKVIEWTSHHKDDANMEELEDLISPWDKDFLNVDMDTLFELMFVAIFFGHLGVMCNSAKK